MSTIGILGDLHTRKGSPIERVDDYRTAHWQKLDQAFSVFKKLQVDAIIAPGDIFNNYGRDSYEVLYDLIDFLKKWGLPLYIVKGQHDIRFHNLDVRDTPMQILIRTNLVHPLSNIGVHIDRDTCLFGANFGERLFDVPKADHGKYNILAMHKMIINGKKLWPGQTDYSQARLLERKYKYDLFVCGDNHGAFTNGKVINCGSLMRMRIDQADHKPMFGLFHPPTGKLETFEYDIAPAHKVLGSYDHILGNMKKLDKDQKKALVESLATDFEGGTDYKKNIREVMKKKRRVRKRTRQIIEEALTYVKS